MSGRVRALFLCALIAGCGGRSLSGSASKDASVPEVMPAPDVRESGRDLDDRIGPVDLAQSPPTLTLKCDGAAGALAFEMPCLVGMNLAGNSQSGPGLHATECRIAQSGAPLAWSFILPLGQVAKDPGLLLNIPGDLPAPPPSSDVIELKGEGARLSSITGTLSFSRVDPTGRAFIGALVGKAVWRGASGLETTCDVEGPFWGAPGGFL